MLRETSQSQEKRYHAHFPSKEQEKTMKNKRVGGFLGKWEGVEGVGEENRRAIQK